jgi:N-acetyl-gamma-glutamyl-phosphate reductase
VFGKDSSIQVSVIIDNLGKGASGAAIQNMNIALGLDEGIGL